MTRNQNPRLDRTTFAWCAAAVATALLPLAPSLPGWLIGLVFALVAVGTVYGWRGLNLTAWVRLPLTIAMAGVVLVAFSFRFGRDTGAALLATMLALKLLETRRVRDARSVLSFAMFSVMAGFLQDQGPLTLVLALIATLMSLSAMARVADSELPLPGGVMEPKVRERVLVAARMLAVSIPLAIAGFFLFPRLGSPLWGVPDNTREARTGLSDEMAPGDIANLYTDDTPAFRVSFEGPVPDQSKLYWRGPVLGSFDGRTWSRWRSSSEFEPVPLLAPGAPVAYEVMLEPTDRHYLIALDVPSTAPPDTRLGLDRSLTARRVQSQLSRYRVVSYTSYRFDPDQRRMLRRWYTGLPPGYNPRTRALMAQWQQAGTQGEQLILRSLALFRAEFTYTLKPMLLGRDSVDDFLFNTKQGYCEHFASALVVMMRAAGIPARVVTGYQGGRGNGVGDYWVVRHSDAHAWAEVWLENRGWVRVDPTSAVAPQRIERGTDSLAPESTWGRLSRPLFDAGDWLRRSWNDLVLGFNAARQRGLLQPFGIPEASTSQLGIALGIGAGLALAITVGLLLRVPRGPRDPLRQAYAQFVARLSRAGAPKPPSEAPLNYAERAAALLPHAAHEVLALSRRYARRRYAPVQPDPREDAALCEDLRRFRVARSKGSTSRRSA